MLRTEFPLKPKKDTAMTANPMMDPAHLLDEHLAQASPDLMRTMLRSFIDTLMSADADAVCGAEYGASSPERVNTRNGYRHRPFDTRVGTIDVAIPSCARAPTSPTGCWSGAGALKRALTTVVATAYLLGVSTRRMEKLVETLGITRLSKSQVSEMAKTSTPRSKRSAPPPERRPLHVRRR